MKMNVVIVSAVFPPEPVISAQTSFDIANELSQNGHNVTVLTTFPNRPAGKLFPGYKRKLYLIEKRTIGLKIIHCFHTLSSESSVMSRTLENISFGITSALFLALIPKIDVVYSNSWPIFASSFICFICWLRGFKMVTSVQDVYPESLISQKRMGQSSNIVLIMRFVDRLIARNSDSLIVISKTFKDIYEQNRRINSEKLHIIPNWSLFHFEEDNLRSTQIKQRLNIPENAFLAVYGGNIGEAAGIEVFVEAFRYLGDLPIYLLIAGSGPNLANCRRLAQQIKGDKIKFLSPWKAEETNSVLSCANLLILPTHGSQSLYSVPSKSITYMMSGRPILALCKPESELEKLILDSSSGWVIHLDDPQLLSERLKEIVSLPNETLLELGNNGKIYAQREFSKDSCLPRVIYLLHDAARKSSK